MDRRAHLSRTASRTNDNRSVLRVGENDRNVTTRQEFRQKQASQRKMPNALNALINLFVLPSQQEKNNLTPLEKKISDQKTIEYVLSTLILCAGAVILTIYYF